MTNCPECGEVLTETIEGSSQTFKCESCGWNIARSWTEPINEDETVYRMEIIPGQSADKAKLSLISKIAGCNFITAKELIEDGCTELVSCRAPEMKTHLENMQSVDMEFNIEPEFPY